MYCNVMYDYNDTAVMIIDIFQENKSTDYTTIVIVSLERTTWQFNMADWNPHVCFAKSVEPQFFVGKYALCWFIKSIKTRSRFAYIFIASCPPLFLVQRLDIWLVSIPMFID